MTSDLIVEIAAPESTKSLTHRLLTNRYTTHGTSCMVLDEICGMLHMMGCFGCCAIILGPRLGLQSTDRWSLNVPDQWYLYDVDCVDDVDLWNTLEIIEFFLGKFGNCDRLFAFPLDDAKVE